MLQPIAFERYSFTSDVIRRAVWLYFRFSQRFRDVEELLAARGADLSNKTIRCWTIKSGALIARRLKKQRWLPPPRWHLDEVVCNNGDKQMLLWRAFDDEGKVLDVMVQRRWDTETALKRLRRLRGNQPVEPQTITTDGLEIDGAASPTWSLWLLY